ncbi:MAG: nucleotide exchange factor GrpE [Bacteroidales bacterium]|jgi:molecular chaperone GrpE
MDKEKNKEVDDVTFEDQRDMNSDNNKSAQNDPQNDAKHGKETKKSKKNKVEKQIEELEQKCEESNDKYLRLYSEFDNYRKRTQKERLELLKTASQEIIVDLLPVLDDFERAISALTTSHANEDSTKGVELIFGKLFSVLSQKGLESMDAMGKEFDTDFHEAITNIPAPNKDQIGKVVDVVQKGYLLNGKIIRFAKVVVGS